MSGFVRLDRSAFDHPLLKDDKRFRAWFWMVAKACWKPHDFDLNGKTITLQRSQFVASRNQLASEWGWSASAVERFLTRLETEQMIERATGQGRSIITICNYDKYNPLDNETGQATGQATGQRADKQRTAKEQGNKGTIDSPLPPQGGRRGKTVIPENWKAPQIEDLPPQAQKRARQWPEGQYARRAEEFHSYWLSRRQMMADWRLTWASRVNSIHEQVMRSAAQRGLPGQQSSTPFLDHMRRQEQAR